MPIPETRTALVTLRIEGLHCAACVARAEKALAAVPAVLEARVSLATGKATVLYDSDRAAAGLPGELAAAVEKAGYHAFLADARRRLLVGVGGMTCASCAATVEKALGALAGVESVAVNLATEQAALALSGPPPAEEELRRAVESAGYGYLGLAEQADPDTDRERRALELGRLGSELVFSAALAAVVAGIEMGHMLWPSFLRLPILLFALTLLILAVPGRRFFAGAWGALRHGTADMNTLVATGTGSAFLISAAATFYPSLFSGMTPPLYYDTAAVIVTLVLLGRWLEARAKGKSSESIRALMDLAPRLARLRTPDGEKEVPAASVRIGDVVLVRPGEQVAVDGEVVEGRSQVDESMLTGESLPVTKQAGATVHAGTLNTLGAFAFRATRVGSATTLARIVRLVEQAQGSKAPIQRLADRVAAVFVPWVIGIAAAAFTVWLAWGPSPSLTYAFTVFASVLLISCPCAMGLATPTAIIVGTGRGARAGVLFRDAEALEELQRATVLVFDKTGTLTTGKLAVTDVVPAPGPASSSGPAPDGLLALAAAVEAGSEHPLGAAVVAEAMARKIVIPPVQGFSALPGRGVEALMGSETAPDALLVGSRRLMDERGIDISTVFTAAERMAARGRSVMFVALGGRVLGALAVADATRPEARGVVQELTRRGVMVAMLTGDNQATADAVALELGIGRVLAQVLPEGKAAAVKALQDEGLRVAMVGDGINDAPALAQANVGLAMGGGTDVALETAGVTLMRGDLAAVLTALDLSRRTMRTIRQNLFWAFAYNVAMIPIAAGALYPFTGLLLQPMFAAGAMAFSSVFVVTNSLRLASVSTPTRS